ncbi:helix-turn-helix domain-containing protein [Actinomadura rupiterrae]|uniref:helix-turn-helix domain-containing protein n=1 Tax=Actinomadura rupiterrae TaxID=559627 RepID=UPI0020A2DDB1|nr:helix-turn-helix domain-containing protein [Actinomadura rupiterrae]MCP2338595.1 transcriptional regulator with XRE-family HTH domain [Actinomadura rupiterrae]
MPNERLRAALLQKRVTIAALAEEVGVDPKTVERWVTKDREPYRRTRLAVASFLGVDETYLWPNALSTEQVASASTSEIVTIYPHRWAVPRDTWGRLFTEAQTEIGILVYSGLFLAEDGGVQRLLADKARTGVRIRILLGDPEASQVAERGADEGIGEAMPAKVRSVISLYKPLRAVEGVEFRLHSTVLYNSIYFADDELFVNTHVYGVPANNAPFWHLRRIPGGEIVSTYRESFERVWEGAKPLAPEA